MVERCRATLGSLQQAESRKLKTNVSAQAASTFDKTGFSVLNSWMEELVCIVITHQPSELVRSSDAATMSYDCYRVQEKVVFDFNL